MQTRDEAVAGGLLDLGVEDHFVVQRDSAVGPPAHDVAGSSRVVAEVATVAQQVVVRDGLEQLLWRWLTSANAKKRQTGECESFGSNGGSAYSNTAGCDGTAEGFRFSCF
jgi:hypothetical protein